MDCRRQLPADVDMRWWPEAMLLAREREREREEAKVIYLLSARGCMHTRSLLYIAAYTDAAPHNRHIYCMLLAGLTCAINLLPLKKTPPAPVDDTQTHINGLLGAILAASNTCPIIRHHAYF